MINTLLIKMESEKLKLELEQYKSQYEQLTFAISVSPESKDKEHLISLQKDIKELIDLTTQSIGESSKDEEDPMDAEYKAFQAQLAELDQPSPSRSSDLLTEELKELEGSKCQAPYVCSWGNTATYHNALVFHIETSESQTSDDPSFQVRVMFTHPIIKEMLPCPYYLNGECKFTDDRCHFSHGAVVALQELKEYKDPDFSKIIEGSVVLAKYTDQLWHRAIVTAIQGETYLLTFESRKLEVENHLSDIFPLNESAEETLNSEQDTEHLNELQDELEIAKRVLLAPPSSALGEWEKYTTGFGSRIMAQMGYITGSGLGVKANGRIEPVPAVIFPAGKSLDHCMQLKEHAGGDQDLFKAERKMKIQQLKHEKALSRAYEKEQNKKDVFSFLNQNIGVGVSPPDKPSSSSTPNIPCLRKESSKRLNVTSLQLSEDIKKTEKEIKALKQSLTRQTKNTPAYSNIQEKLQKKETELEQYRLSENRISKEQEQRKDRQKLSIF